MLTVQYHDMQFKYLNHSSVCGYHSCQLPEWKIRDKYLSRVKMFDHAPYFRSPTHN